MTTTTIIAYLGALAWVPQLIYGGYVYFIKPKIRIIPDRTVQIGFTTFGPIFNLRTSIDVSNKDSIIDYLGVKLTHQDGSCFEFEWMGMNEIYSEVIPRGADDNKSQIVQKDVSPIAIKVSRLSLVERFFRFQETNFLAENRIKQDKLSNDITTAQKLLAENKSSDFIFKEINEYFSFLKEKFIWKAGNYTVEFIIKSPERFKYKPLEISFCLAQYDIDLLQNNFSQIEKIKTFLEEKIKTPDAVFPENQPWNWINPSLTKKN